MSRLPAFNGPSLDEPLGNNKYWRKTADSHPADMYRADTWFDWWVYRHVSNRGEFLVMVQPGAAADYQETQNFMRDFMSRASQIGATFGPTGGGRPDYLNDPAKIIVYSNQGAAPLAKILRNLAHFYQQGLDDMAHDIADKIKGSLGWK